VGVGLTIPFHGVVLNKLRPLVRKVGTAGNDSVWSEEPVNFDGITPLVAAAQNTGRLSWQAGSLSVFTRRPAVLAQTAAPG
jgi:alkanesulfonate monooxygenase SsuD/methylene tetrahydromethanopterin reductase-like flavin-dependent oxidoreductase (luciferase family)